MKDYNSNWDLELLIWMMTPLLIDAPRKISKNLYNASLLEWIKRPVQYVRENWVKVKWFTYKNRSYRVPTTNNHKPAINTITNSGNIVSHWLNRIMDLIIVIHLTAKNEDCTRSTSHILSGIFRNWWAQMGTHTSLRKKINLRNIVWNPKTNSYTDVEGNSYLTYEQYRMQKWKCDKCGVAFSTYQIEVAQGWNSFILNSH